MEQQLKLMAQCYLDYDFKALKSKVPYRALTLLFEGLGKHAHFVEHLQSPLPGVLSPHTQVYHTCVECHPRLGLGACGHRPGLL